MDTLFNKQKYTQKMNMVHSKHHNIYGPTVNKTTLTACQKKEKERNS